MWDFMYNVIWCFTDGQKCGTNCDFYVFERSLFCSPKLHLFDQKCSKNSDIVKYYCFNIFV